MSAVLTSDQVNFLIYRYLLESGFVHSAYAFGHESYVAKSQIDTKQVPPGALISFIQKGLQYVEMESHVHEDGTESLCDASFSVLESHTCNSTNKRQIFDPYETYDIDYGDLEIEDDEVVTLKGHSDMVTIVYWHPAGPMVVTGAADSSVRIWNVDQLRRQLDDNMDDDDEDEKDNHVNNVMTSHMRICRHGSADSKSNGLEGDSDHEDTAVKNKRGRSKKQKKTKKSSRSKEKDSDDEGEPATKKRRTRESSRTDVSEAPEPQNHTIVCGEWNAQGTRFASGDYAGSIFIWTDKGECAHELHQHSGPVSSVRWNSRGNYLLSTSIDGVAILWDMTKATVKQKYSDHSGPILDCDWRSDTAFVTCSADKIICLASVSSQTRQLTGHTGEVNAVRWDPAGRLLASISDDCTVKLWNTAAECIASAQSHSRGISCLSWSRTGPCTENPDLPLMLATGSLDCTVRIWNVQEGILHCIHTLKHHTHPVVTIAFAPDIQPDLLASGSHDRIYVWSVKDGTILKTFRAPDGGVNSLSWRSSGTQLAAGYSDGSTFVLDIPRS